MHQGRIRALRQGVSIGELVHDAFSCLSLFCTGVPAWANPQHRRSTCRLAAVAASGEMLPGTCELIPADQGSQGPPSSSYFPRASPSTADACTEMSVLSLVLTTLLFLSKKKDCSFQFALLLNNPYDSTSVHKIYKDLRHFECAEEHKRLSHVRAA